MESEPITNEQKQIRINKRILFFGVLILGIIIFTIIFSAFNRKNTNQSQNNQEKNGNINPQIHQFTSLQKTVIGKTTNKDLSTKPYVISMENNKDTTVYTVTSVDPLSKDRIITKNGVVVFERTSTFTSNKGGYPSIKEFLKLLGNPDEQVTGSKSYGRFMITYVFASKGIVFIGNPTVDKVIELQRFIPMSLEDYKKTYGADLNPNPTPGI